MNHPGYLYERSVWDIVTTSYSLYIRYFPKLLGLSIVIQLISLLIYLPLVLAQLSGLYFNGSVMELNIMRGIAFAFFMGPLLQLFNSALFMGASNLIVGRPLSVREAISHVLSPILFVRLFAVSILLAVVLYTGMLLLIVPGIIWSVQYTFAIYVMVLEKVTPSEAMARSRFLVQSHWWRVLFTLLLTSILSTLFSTVVSAVGFGLVFSANSIEMVAVYLLIALFLPTLLVAPPILSNILLYYDLRVRKENFTEEILAEELAFKPLEEMMTI